MPIILFLYSLHCFSFVTVVDKLSVVIDCLVNCYSYLISDCFHAFNGLQDGKPETPLVQTPVELANDAVIKDPPLEEEVKPLYAGDTQ